MTVVRLRSLLQAYLREAQHPVSTERALEMAIDLESSELEDLVVDLMQVVEDGPWREQASQFLIHEQSVICVPWDNAGAYLRFSVTYLAKDEAEEDSLMQETAERLGRLHLRF